MNSIIGRIATLVSRMLDWALLPAAAAHEATHLLVVAPYVVRVEDMGLRELGSLEVTLSEHAPSIVVRVAAAAPAVVGSAFGLAAVAAYAGYGMRPPAAVESAGAWLAVGAYWFAYSVPSRQDLRVMLYGDGD